MIKVTATDWCVPQRDSSLKILMIVSDVSTLLSFLHFLFFKILIYFFGCARSWLWCTGSSVLDVT